MTEDKKKQIKNHLSRIRGHLTTFDACMDVRVKKEKENPYFLELINEMETLLQASKKIINQKE